MVHIETMCIEGPFDGQVQSQMKGKIPENKTPVLAQASLPTDPANKPRASSTIQQVQRDIDRRPHQAYLIMNKMPIHCNGGANSHITTSLDTLLWYRKVKSNVTMANGTKSPAEGYGCQLVRFPRDNRVYALWPVYYMPNNEWPTLSTPALRVYNGFRRASVHALESLEITDKSGRNLTIPTRPIEQNCYHLDFIEIEYVKPLEIVNRPIVPPMTAAVTTRAQSNRLKDIVKTPTPAAPTETPLPPNRVPKLITNEEETHLDGARDTGQQHQAVKRTSHGLTAEILHQRLGHINYDVIQHMCKEGTILGLPKSIQIPTSPCIVCLKAKATRIPKGHTVSTDTLRPGQRLHMDFSFFSKVSV